MSITTERLQDSSLRLHSYILRRHWDGQSLAGPDAGIRFNARVGRFVKSYLGFLPWSDSYRYVQAQAYWIFSNWQMRDLLDDGSAGELALACTGYVRSAQSPQGHWDYPNPEWREG